MPQTDPRDAFDITLYGTRGSIPAPQSGAEVQSQIAHALFEAGRSGARFSSVDEAEAWLIANIPFHQRASYGGDTTSFLVRCGSNRIIVDAGSGIRRLGIDLIPELSREGRLDIDILFTHMHLDHIVGFPFFMPLFVPKARYPVCLTMYGGAAWQDNLEEVLSSTVSAPLFPVNLDKLQFEAATLAYRPVFDGLSFTLGAADEIKVRCRRLHHPNETYGWRIEYGGRAFVVATDTEPYAGPDRVLAELAAGADVLYTDAQFDRAQYVGDFDGISRVGWGHGYAEWCGQYAREAGACLALCGHHDPASSNQRIFEIGEKMRAEFADTVVAHDGLRLSITDAEVIVRGAGHCGEDLRRPRRG